MDLQKLESIGVTKALAPRTLASLILLGFYDDEGQITPEFEALREVPKLDFEPHLGDLLRKAYSPILEVLDPWTATRTEIEDAFRTFNPPGMLPRMAQLFEGLMTFAELRPETSRRPGGSQSADKPAGRNTTPVRGSSHTRNSKTNAKPENQPPHPAPPISDSVDDMKRAYFDLLIEKAKQADSDDGLLDRIERLVGIEPGKRQDRDRITAGFTATPTGSTSQGEG
jgi:hypothetical protein